MLQVNVASLSIYLKIYLNIATSPLIVTYNQGKENFHFLDLLGRLVNQFQLNI